MKSTPGSSAHMLRNVSRSCAFHAANRRRATASSSGDGSTAWPTPVRLTRRPRPPLLILPDMERGCTRCAEKGGAAKNRPRHRVARGHVIDDAACCESRPGLVVDGLRLIARHDALLEETVRELGPGETHRLQRECVQHERVRVVPSASVISSSRTASAAIASSVPSGPAGGQSIRRRSPTTPASENSKSSNVRPAFGADACEPAIVAGVVDANFVQRHAGKKQRSECMRRFVIARFMVGARPAPRDGVAVTFRRARHAQAGRARRLSPCRRPPRRMRSSRYAHSDRIAHPVDCLFRHLIRDCGQLRIVRTNLQFPHHTVRPSGAPSDSVRCGRQPCPRARARR